MEEESNSKRGRYDPERFAQWEKTLEERWVPRINPPENPPENLPRTPIQLFLFPDAQRMTLELYTAVVHHSNVNVAILEGRNNDVNAMMQERLKVNPDLRRMISMHRPTLVEMTGLPSLLKLVVVLVNVVDGPFVVWRGVDRGYGLIADRTYRYPAVQKFGGAEIGGEFITHYGGREGMRGEFHSDYVMEATKNKTAKDGLYGFQLQNKGRWANDNVANYNAVIDENWAMRVRRERTIERGQEIFINYGKDFQRTWQQCKSCATPFPQFMCGGECQGSVFFCSQQCADSAVANGTHDC